MKPILFNTEMVRAILEGRKTQTRRVIKPRLKKDEYGWRVVCSGDLKPLYVKSVDEKEGQVRAIPSLYQIGDILYVRETWFYESLLEEEETDSSRRYIYRASEPDYPVNVGAGGTGWRPSIHMPKSAARIFLRVTDVRVERLHEMRLKDCLAEGVRLTTAEELDKVTAPIVARKRFSEIWNSTIKPADLDRYGWDANPWVWVYEFERIEKQ